MITAYRRLDWHDGFDIAECLSCGCGMVSPDVFCTCCGVRWTHCIVNTPQDARERKPGRGETWRREREYEYGVHPVSFLVQGRCTLFDKEIDLKTWHTYQSHLSPRSALEHLRRERDRGEEDMLYRVIKEPKEE